MSQEEKRDLHIYTAIGYELWGEHRMYSRAYRVIAKDVKEAKWIITCRIELGEIEDLLYELKTGIHVILKGEPRYIGDGEESYPYPLRKKAYDIQIDELRQRGYKTILRKSQQGE